MSPFGTTTTHTYKLLPSPAAATASLLHLAGFRTLETAGLAIAIVRSHDRAFRHTDFAMPVLGIQIIRTYRTSTQGRLSGGLSATRVQHESVHHRAAFLYHHSRQPQRFTLISRWSQRRRVGGVIGLEASGCGFGSTRLGGGIALARR